MQVYKKELPVALKKATLDNSEMLVRFYKLIQGNHLWPGTSHWTSLRLQVILRKFHFIMICYLFSVKYQVTPREI